MFKWLRDRKSNRYWRRALTYKYLLRQITDRRNKEILWYYCKEFVSLVLKSPNVTPTRSIKVVERRFEKAYEPEFYNDPELGLEQLSWDNI